MLKLKFKCTFNQSEIYDNYSIQQKKLKTKLIFPWMNTGFWIYWICSLRSSEHFHITAKILTQTAIASKFLIENNTNNYSFIWEANAQTQHSWREKKELKNSEWLSYNQCTFEWHWIFFICQNVCPPSSWNIWTRKLPAISIPLLLCTSIKYKCYIYSRNWRIDKWTVQVFFPTKHCSNPKSVIKSRCYAFEIHQKNMKYAFLTLAIKIGKFAKRFECISKLCFCSSATQQIHVFYIWFIVFLFLHECSKNDKIIWIRCVFRQIGRK
jgi:hypothetical protein